MSDDEDEPDGPVVGLGDGPRVEGAPVARVASRLTWPIERSRLLDREGDAEIRTPDGPRTVADVLAGVDVTYFDTRRTFVEVVRDEVGRGPVAVSDTPETEAEAEAQPDPETDEAGPDATEPEGDTESDGTEPGDGDGGTGADADTDAGDGDRGEGE